MYICYSREFVLEFELSFEVERTYLFVVVDVELCERFEAYKDNIILSDFYLE